MFTTKIITRKETCPAARICYVIEIWTTIKLRRVGYDSSYCNPKKDQHARCGSDRTPREEANSAIATTICIYLNPAYNYDFVTRVNFNSAGLGILALQYFTGQQLEFKILFIYLLEGG